MKCATVETSTRRMRVWVGDVLEGDDERIEIMYLGNGGDLIIARSIRADGLVDSEMDWTLQDRDWRVVQRRKRR